MGQTTTDPSPPSPPAKLRRSRLRVWTLRFLSAVFIIIVSAIASHAIWGWVESSKLDAEIAKFRAMGEPVTPGDLPAPSTADAANIAMTYQTAINAAVTRGAEWDRYNDADNDQYVPPFQSTERADIAAIVSANTTALNHVEAARKLSPGSADWKPKFTPPLLDMLLPDLKTARTLARITRLAAFDAFAADRHDLALAYGRDVLRLGDSFKQPVLVGGLVSIGISALGTDTIARITPDLRIGSNPNDASREDVKACIAELLDDSHQREIFRYSLQTERMSILDTLLRFERGSSIGFSSVQGTPPAKRTVSQAMSARVMGYLLKPVVLGDSRQLLGFMQQIIDSRNQPNVVAAEAALKSDWYESIKSKVWHLPASILVPSMNRVIEVNFRQKSERRLAAAALAIRLYQLDHDGKRPAKLDELVPTYLPAAPIDGMSNGGTILYFTDNDPRVYSVGENGVDDGGKDEPTSGTRLRRSRDSDVVIHLTTRPRPPKEQPESE